MRQLAEKKYPTDKAQLKEKEILSLNKFEPGDGVCNFAAIASKNRKTGMVKVSKNSTLTHSSVCPVAGGKVKASMLKQSPQFRATVQAAGGKAKLPVLRAEGAKHGLGDLAASNAVMYAAQRSIRELANLAWDKQWAELPALLKKLADSGMAFVKLDTDNDEVFQRAFVAYHPVHNAQKVAGRPVCSTDFGHVKHDFFDGLNATGLFQMGDGTLLALWAAIFKENSESIFMWE